MRKFIILAVIPLFISGTTANSSMVAPMAQIQPCNCGDSIDSVLPDTIRTIVIKATDSKVDSFKTAKLAELDSLNYLKDSLATELRHLKNEKYKKLIIKEIDTIPGWIWKWGYWQFPDGSTRFHKVYKIKYRS